MMTLTTLTTTMMMNDRIYSLARVGIGLGPSCARDQLDERSIAADAGHHRLVMLVKTCQDTEVPAGSISFFK